MSLCKSISRTLILRLSTRTGVCKLSQVASSSNTVEEKDVKDQYDIIIAGGGMVGCTLACALAKNPILTELKIMLLEGSQKKPFTLKPEYSNRVVALNQSTKKLMSGIGVWEKVEKMRLQPIHTMQVWDAYSDAQITFDRSDIEEDIAYIVENDVLLHAVNTELECKGSNVHIVYGAKIKQCELPASSSPAMLSTVTMEDGKAYTCRLLVGADGANSHVRQRMGAQYLKWNYDQMGVVATLKLAECTNEHTAWQRFLTSGPVAMLPLGPGLSSLVWSTSVQHAKQLLALPEDQFVDAVNDAFWHQYPRNSTVDSAVSTVSSALRSLGLRECATRHLPPSVLSVATGSRAAFPLGFGHATKYVAPGVALVGDAAHRVHPLAGQGVNLGFGDVRDLVRLLADSLHAGEHINSERWLAEYECVRQRHNVPTQLTIDALHRLYSLSPAPVVLLRSVLLQLAHATTPLKKAIMSHASK